MKGRGASVFAVAVAALTESEVSAAIQPGAEAVMGEVARGLHDQLAIADMPSGGV